MLQKLVIKTLKTIFPINDIIFWKTKMMVSDEIVQTDHYSDNRYLF